MWSHYADKHKGICIGIKIPWYSRFLRNDKEHDIFSLMVKYEDKISPMLYFNDNEDEKTIALINWIYTKSKIWEYESEIRTYIPNLNGTVTNEQIFDLGIEPEMVCEIYYGLATTSAQIEELQSIIAGRYNVKKTGKMYINQGTFDLAIKPL